MTDVFKRGKIGVCSEVISTIWESGTCNEESSKLWVWIPECFKGVDSSIVKRKGKNNAYGHFAFLSFASCIARIVVTRELASTFREQ